jgi:hypothetical protein
VKFKVRSYTHICGQRKFYTCIRQRHFRKLTKIIHLTLEEASSSGKLGGKPVTTSPTISLWSGYFWIKDASNKNNPLPPLRMMTRINSVTLSWFLCGGLEWNIFNTCSFPCRVCGIVGFLYGTCNTALLVLFSSLPGLAACLVTVQCKVDAVNQTRHTTSEVWASFIYTFLLS